MEGGIELSFGDSEKQEGNNEFEGGTDSVHNLATAENALERTGVALVTKDDGSVDKFVKETVFSSLQQNHSQEELQRCFDGINWDV